MSTDENNEPYNGEKIYTLEEAMELAGNGKFQYLIVAIGGLAAMTVVIEAQAMSVVLPAAKCDLDISVTEQGLLNSISYAGIVISSHFWGFTTDTWGRYKTLNLVLLLSVICSVLSSFSLTSWMLLVSRFIVGICSSGTKVASTAYYGEFFSPKNRAKYFTILIMLTAAGMMVQNLLALGIITGNVQFELGSWLSMKPWRVLILIGNSITIISYLLLLFLPETPMYEMAMNRKENALKTLQTIYKINTGKSKKMRVYKYYPVKNILPLDATGSNLTDVHSFVDAIKLIWNQTWPLFRSPYLINITAMCILAFVYFALTQGNTIWLPQIIAYTTNYIDEPISMCQALYNGQNAQENNNIGNSSNVDAEIDECDLNINPLTYQLLLMFSGFMFCLSIMTTILMKKFGQTILLTTWNSLGVVATLAIIWTHNFYINTALLFMLCSTISTIFMLVPMSGDLFPIHHKGMAISLIFLVGRVGSVGGINAIGAMLFNFCTALFGTQTALLLFCTILSFYVLRQTEKGVNVGDNDIVKKI